MKLIVLANSYKLGGRCLAGIDVATGTWVRPISSETHGELDANRCLINENGRLRSVRCLDVIEIPIGGPVSTPGQPENRRLLVGDWSFTVSLDRKNAVDALDALTLEDDSTELLFNKDSEVAYSEELNGQVLKSLTLVKVTDPTFYLRLRHGIRPQLRAKFLFADIEYDLPITDDRKWTTYAREEPERFSSGIWYFTISLGEPYKEKMWKLIAGGMSRDLIMK